MSKRHQSHRRKTYGRRQHELRERHDRGQHTHATELVDEMSPGGPSDPLTFLDPRTPRYRFALGD